MDAEMGYWDCECGAKVPSYEGSICIDCRKAATLVVATVHVEKAFDLQRPEESASAYHVIRVEEGTYPVELRMDGRGRQYLSALFTGNVTSSGYGSKSYPENVGKTDTIGLSPYKYQLQNGRFWGNVTVTNAAAIELASGV